MLGPCLPAVPPLSPPRPSPHPQGKAQLSRTRAWMNQARFRQPFSVCPAAKRKGRVGHEPQKTVHTRQGAPRECGGGVGSTTLPGDRAQRGWGGAGQVQGCPAGTARKAWRDRSLPECVQGQTSRASASSPRPRALAAGSNPFPAALPVRYWSPASPRQSRGPPRCCSMATVTLSQGLPGHPVPGLPGHSGKDTEEAVTFLWRPETQPPSASAGPATWAVLNRDPQAAHLEMQ